MAPSVAPLPAADPVLPTRSAAAHATTIADQFKTYNEEFGRITRRAALHFMACDWRAAAADSVARIELYEQHVERCVHFLSNFPDARAGNVAAWIEIKGAYEQLVARRPDGDFYRTFFNSVTRDIFRTVGVNIAVEFCATNVGRTAGSVAIRVYRVGSALPGAVREILADLPFTAFIADPDGAVHRISAEIGRYFENHRQSAAPDSIEFVEPLFYRGANAFLVGRLIDDNSITPIAIAFSNSAVGAPRSPLCSALRVPTFTSICPSSARRSPCCARSCLANPSTSCTRCSAGPSRARRSAISPCVAISTLRSTPSCMRRASRVS
jgi:isocitrate dehydrogenase kinase/phosphatase